MKKLIFTKGNGILALCAFVCLSLIYVACSKDKGLTSATEKPTLVSTEKSESMLDVSESIGKTVYQHAKYNFLTKKAEDYISPKIRDEVTAEHKRLNDLFNGMSSEQIMENLISQKKITDKQVFYFNSLKNLTNELDNMSNIKQMDDALKLFDKKLDDDKSINNNDKIVILSASSTIRYVLDYHFEVSKKFDNNLQTREACFLSIKISCWGTQVVANALKTLFAPSPLQVAVTLLNSIASVITLYSTPSCLCTASDGPSCYTLNGVSIFMDNSTDCAGNNIAFAAFGVGPVPTSFSWTKSELNEAGAIIPNTTEPLPNTGTPNINLGSMDINKTFLLTVSILGTFPSCNNAAQTKSFAFKVKDIVGDPGTVIVSGPTNTYKNNTDTYFVNGSCLTNRRNTLGWFFSTSQGSINYAQVVSGGANNDFALTLKWLAKTCFGYSCIPVSISVRSLNQCGSQLQSWGSTSVFVNEY
jgi:hypothetical protein